MGHGFGRGEPGMAWKCSSSPGIFRTDLEREGLKLDPFCRQLGCAVVPVSKALCRLSQCHQ